MDNVVSLLQELQDKEGYLSHDSMIRLSREKRIPAVDICGVATFYAQFKFKKPGKYLVSICRGTACHVKNSLLILQAAEELLKIQPGETTSDVKFSLECVNCIGACAKAPSMMINGTVYGELTPEKASKILESLP